MIPEILANANPDTPISGNWIIAMIGALAAAAAAIMGKMQGRKQAMSARLESPVPEVPTRKVSVPPTWSDHKALLDRMNRTEADVLRVEAELKEMRTLQSAQFQAIMQAGADRQQAINDKLDGVATGIHRRIDEILTTHKPRPAR